MRKSVLLFLLLLPLTTLAKEPVVDEAAVWQLEEAYWQYAKANDLDSYRALWDEQFVGWPNFSPRALGKANIADWIPPLHEDPERLFDFRLQKEAVRAFGDSIAVHYLVWELWRDAKTGAVVQEDAPLRITHTWQRRGDRWQIITGMSATYEH